MKQKTDWRIVATGIAGLTTIEVVALLNGINGVLLSTIVGIIALAIGLTIPNPIKTN